MDVALSKLESTALDYIKVWAEFDVQGLVDTLEDDPVYDLYPVSKRFSGMSKTRRFYQYFMTEVLPRIVGVTIRSEAIGNKGLAREYDVSVLLPGADAPSEHRICAFVNFGAERLSGERIYTDQKMLRFLVGPLWNSLEPIPAD